MINLPLLLVLLLIVLCCIVCEGAISDQRVLQVLQGQAPVFAHAILTYAPHLHTWLQSPDAPFTLFAPIDSVCSIDALAQGMTPISLDSILRYHIAQGRSSLTGTTMLLETGLEGGGQFAPLCHLPAGYRQRIKVYPNTAGHTVVFDGELPEALVLNTISCRDGLLVLLDRSLFPPLVTPGSILNVTPVKELLEGLLQFGQADYRTAPLTLFVPSNLMWADHFLKDPQLTGAHAVHGIYYSAELQPGQVLYSLTGRQLVVSDDGQDYGVNGIRILFYDVPTSFGVVHVLERNLANMPEPATTTQDTASTSQMPTIKSTAVRMPGIVGQTLSATTCLMVAGAVAVCMAISYVAYRRR